MIAKKKRNLNLNTENGKDFCIFKFSKCYNLQIGIIKINDVVVSYKSVGMSRGMSKPHLQKLTAMAVVGVL